MADKHGDWVWYELMTPDAEGAERFYAPLLGWTVEGDVRYREVGTREGKVGGLVALTPEMIAAGAKPGWIGYVNAADVDQAVTSVEHGGGRALMPPRDLPGVGRFAMLADPAGAPFYIMTPEPGGEADATSAAFAAERPMPGHVAWNELATTDVAEAFHFYGTRFGWVKDGEMDMGPNGTYYFIRHGAVTGGMAPVMPGHEPRWTFYFRVASIPAAVDAVEASGGRVIMGPHPIPGGDHIVVGVDPQGASFALVGEG